MLDKIRLVVFRLTHSQYYLQYANKPLQFRNGANNGKIMVRLGYIKLD